jgi:catechol 2,3-dioxygenase-like lactoylglutathione lyase family enzyme
MELSLQTALLNVTDLQQSIEFYRDVFEFRLVWQGDRVAALMVTERSRRQVLLLREFSRNAYHGGRGNIGVRMISFEAGSPGELDVIEQRIVERQALLWHQTTETYRAIMGLDPDGIEVAVSSSLNETPIPSEAWNNIDDMIYTVE